MGALHLFHLKGWKRNKWGKEEVFQRDTSSDFFQIDMGPKRQLAFWDPPSQGIIHVACFLLRSCRAALLTPALKYLLRFDEGKVM